MDFLQAVKNEHNCQLYSLFFSSNFCIWNISSKWILFFSTENHHDNNSVSIMITDTSIFIALFSFQLKQKWKKGAKNKLGQPKKKKKTNWNYYVSFHSYCSILKLRFKRIIADWKYPTLLCKSIYERNENRKNNNDWHSDSKKGLWLFFSLHGMECPN